MGFVQGFAGMDFKGERECRGGERLGCCGNCCISGGFLCLWMMKGEDVLGLLKR